MKDRGREKMVLLLNTWWLWTIANVPLRKRPGRNELRKIKRQNGKYERMKLLRSHEKAALSP